MVGHTHIVGAGAVALGCGVWSGATIEQTALLTISSMLVAHVPDMDQSMARGPHHRGILHSVVLGVLLFGAVYFFSYELRSHSPWNWIVYGAMIGYLSHLLLDSLTPAGIPLLLRHGPTVGLRMISTGSLGDRLLGVAFLIADVALVLHLLGVRVRMG